MSEKLLQAAQIHSVIEAVCSERMPEHVRMDAANPGAQASFAYDPLDGLYVDGSIAASLPNPSGSYGSVFLRVEVPLKEMFKG